MFKRNPKFMPAVEKGLVAALTDSGRLLVDDIKASLHRGSSSPGAPPKSESGELESSIRYQVNETEHSVRVGSDLDYALFLELGTSRMPPRPFLRPALKRNNRRILEQFKDRI